MTPRPARCDELVMSLKHTSTASFVGESSLGGFATETGNRDTATDTASNRLYLIASAIIESVDSLRLTASQSRLFYYRESDTVKKQLYGVSAASAARCAHRAACRWIL